MFGLQRAKEITIENPGLLGKGGLRWIEDLA